MAIPEFKHIARRRADPHPRRRHSRPHPKAKLIALAFYGSLRVEYRFGR
jgi:hypothetical protein